MFILTSCRYVRSLAAMTPYEITHWRNHYPISQIFGSGDSECLKICYWWWELHEKVILEILDDQGHRAISFPKEADDNTIEILDNTLTPLSARLELEALYKESGESYEIESNEIESNETESNEIESNEIESNEIESNQMESEDTGSTETNTNYDHEFFPLVVMEGSFRGRKCDLFLFRWTHDDKVDRLMTARDAPAWSTFIMRQDRPMCPLLQLTCNGQWMESTNPISLTFRLRLSAFLKCEQKAIAQWEN